jgi:hypothetical protein
MIVSYDAEIVASRLVPGPIWRGERRGLMQRDDSAPAPSPRLCAGHPDRDIYST